MSKPLVTSLLTRLLAIVSRSFPQYLQYAHPYIPPGHEDLAEALATIVADQNVLAERISQMLLDNEAPLRSGEFPMEYTDTHDLSIDYLIRLAIDYQRQDIDSIAELVEQLQEAPSAKALAEEALGMAKGHLDTLLELAQPEATVAGKAS